MWGVPFTRGCGSVSNAEGATGGTVHGRDGIVVASDGSGRSRACSDFILQFVLVLLPERDGKRYLCLLLLHERYGSVIHNRSPDFMNVSLGIAWTNIWTDRMTPVGVMPGNTGLD